MITPAGVSAPRGKKKGKTFIDDSVSIPIAHVTLVSWTELIVLSSLGKYDDNPCYG